LEAIKKRFEDFPIHKSPEKGWWIFQRPLHGDRSERISVIVGGSAGFVRIVPSMELRFESIVKLSAEVWEDPERAIWYMPGGLQRSLLDIVPHRSSGWNVDSMSELRSAIEDI